MKPIPFVQSLRALLFGAVSVLSGSTLQAANFFDDSVLGVDLGTASGSNLPGRHCWAIFALTGGVTITNASLPSNPLDYNVVGNIGVAFSGNLNINNARVGGTVYLRNGGTATIGGGSTISGNAGSPLLNQDAILEPAKASAYAAASTAAGLARDTGSGPTLLSLSGLVPAGVLSNDVSSIAFGNVSGGISGAANSNYVLNLTNLILSGAGAVLTLSGASTTNYVINVSRYMSLSGGASIQLSGGLQPQNVLFNLRNTYGYDVTLSGGSSVDGIILAANRNVKLTGQSEVTGEVIARAVSLSGGSKVINPICSP